MAEKAKRGDHVDYYDNANGEPILGIVVSVGQDDVVNLITFDAQGGVGPRLNVPSGEAGHVGRWAPIGSKPKAVKK